MNLEEYLDDYISTQEAALLCNKSTRRIRDWIYEGKIDYIKVDSINRAGFKYMINRKSFLEFLNPGQLIPEVEAPKKTIMRRIKDWIIKSLS